MLKKPFVIRFTAAAAAALIGSFFAAGMSEDPAGSRLYEGLLKMRAPVPESREILLVETGPKEGSFPIRAADLAEALLILTEMDAGRVVIGSPITGDGPIRGDRASEREKTITRRFDQEFDLIERNIRTLFDAIRLGSVRARDSSRYIGDLIDLVDLGKNRLLSEALNTEDSGEAFLERARMVFGKVWAMDIGNRRDGDGGLNTEGDYPSPVPRLKNAGDASARAVFFALLDRIEAPVFEYRDNRLFIPGARLPGREKGDLSIPLNPDGTLQIEPPRTDGEGPPFRRIQWNTLFRYVELERELHRAFSRMERDGYLNEISPENYPTILYEQSRTERNDLLADPQGQTVDRWRRSRDLFFAAAWDFLFGATEEKLLSGYNELLRAETLDEDGASRIAQLRARVFRDFAQTRELYTELSNLRGRLDTELRGSFCIFDMPNFPGGPNVQDLPPTDAEFSALLVNGILTGRFIQTVYGYRYGLLTFFPNLILAGVLAALGTISALLTGFAGALLIGAAAAVALIFAGIWMNPAGPLAVLAAVTFVSVIILIYTSRVFSCAAIAHRTGEKFPVGKAPREVRSALAVIVAVRHTGSPGEGGFQDKERAARERRDFRERTGRRIARAGAYVLNVENAVVLAVFEGPSLLETEIPPKEDSAQILTRGACSAVLDMIGQDLSIDDGCRFGIDIGECVFFTSEFGGPGAVGNPLVHARMLSGLAMKNQCRALVTRRIKDALGKGWRTSVFNAPTLREVRVYPSG